MYIKMGISTGNRSRNTDVGPETAHFGFQILTLYFLCMQYTVWNKFQATQQSTQACSVSLSLHLVHNLLRTHWYAWYCTASASFIFATLVQQGQREWEGDEEMGWRKTDEYMYVEPIFVCVCACVCVCVCERGTKKIYTRCLNFNLINYIKSTTFWIEHIVFFHCLLFEWNLVQGCTTNKMFTLHTEWPHYNTKEQYTVQNLKCKSWEESTSETVLKFIFCLFVFLSTKLNGR